MVDSILPSAASRVAASSGVESAKAECVIVSAANVNAVANFQDGNVESPLKPAHCRSDSCPNMDGNEDNKMAGIAKIGRYRAIQIKTKSDAAGVLRSWLRLAPSRKGRVLSGRNEFQRPNYASMTENESASCGAGKIRSACNDHVFVDRQRPTEVFIGIVIVRTK